MGDFPNTSQDHLTSVGIEPLTQIVSLLFPIKLHKQQPAFNPPPLHFSSAHVGHRSHCGCGPCPYRLYGILHL